MNGSRRFALDSSVLLFDYFAGGTEKVGQLLREGLLNSVTLSETLYVICRIDGINRAARFVEDCVRKATVVSSERVGPLAGQFKCRFPISLANCWALATAKAFNVPCLFAFRETEIQRQLDAIRQEVQLRFLDEPQTL